MDIFLKVKYRFAYCVKNGAHKPLCVLCNEILANESLKPRMSQNLEAFQKTFESAITVQEQALRASGLLPAS